MFFSISLEKTNEGDVRGIVFRHDNDQVLVWAVAESSADNVINWLLEKNPDVTAVRDQNDELHFPDCITIKECLECIYWDLMHDA